MNSDDVPNVDIPENKIPGIDIVVDRKGLDEDESEDAQTRRLVYRSQAFVESMSWLNQSLESLGEKLGKISDELGEDLDKESLERDIKEAIRDAFAHGERGETTVQAVATIPEVPQSLPEVASSASFDGSLSTVPEAPAAPRAPGVPVPIQVAEDASVADSPTSDRPILGEGVPEWIRERIIENDRIRVPIESSMYATIEECREELESKLFGEAKRILDAHALKYVGADEIPELTSSYIREKLIDRNSEFDNYQDRPSGSYHQLWVRMDIDKNELEQIRDWERSILTQERVSKLGGVAGVALASIAGLSGLVGVFARREKKSREKQAGA